MASSQPTPTSDQEPLESPDLPTGAPEIALDTTADYSVPPTQLEQWKTSKWRPIAAFAGALLVGGILMPLIIRAGNAPVTSAPIVSTWELSLPASSTMLTQLSAAPGAPIRGQISPVADITGKAPVGGAVARWSVQPGTAVQAGQDVVQISSGAASAAPLPGESQQIKAEEQQTAAADDQMDLSKQLTTTQQKLTAAQARVEAAQENITKTRALIAKLRAGDAATPALPVPVPRRKTAKTNPKIAAARAATKDAQANYSQTKTLLDNTRADLSASQKALAPLQSKLDDAQKNVTAVEAKFDGSLASASDVQAARSARDNAKGTLKSATTRLETAQKQIPVLEKQLAARERAAEDARRTERTLVAAAPDAPPSADDAPATAPDKNAMSVEEAAKLVDDALAESRAATREADRLRAQVDAYQAQAQKSNQRITQATQQLQNAQQKSQDQMVQAVPRVHFTAATAPANGVVVWIATLAREVGAGQSVFGLASGKKYQARFEDKTGNWKNARVGQVINALLAPPAPATTPAVAASAAPVVKPSASAAGSPPMPVLVSPAPTNSPAIAANVTATPTPELTPGNAAQQGATPVKVRLTRIAPPETPGQPAILEGELIGQNNAAGANYRLLASLPDANAPDILTVPDSALVQRDGAWMVAVIENGDAAPQAEVTPAPDKTAAPDAATAGTLAWREVQVGAGDGVIRRVNGGLKAGERIVTDPLPLLAQAPPDSKTMPRVKLSV